MFLALFVTAAAIHFKMERSTRKMGCHIAIIASKERSQHGVLVVIKLQQEKSLMLSTSSGILNVLPVLIVEDHLMEVRSTRKMESLTVKRIITVPVEMFVMAAKELLLVVVLMLLERNITQNIFSATIV